MKLLLFTLLVACGRVTQPIAGPDAATDATTDANEPPLCSSLGCPNAFCNGNGTCSCNGATCELYPSCTSLGCSNSEPLTCGGISGPCECPVNGANEKCTR